MNDKDFKTQRKRVQKYFQKWFDTLGLGWYQVDVVWSRNDDEENSDTAAKTTWRWQYRTATITFYLQPISEMNDEKLEGVVVHEFSHILTGSMVQNSSDEESQLMEYGTETVARSLIWAREAGKRTKLSSCKSIGGSKVKHLTRLEAEQHRINHQKTTNHRIDVYKCDKCNYWHIGRHKTTKYEKQFTESSNNKKDEIMVGILIGALKRLLDKNLL